MKKITRSRRIAELEVALLVAEEQLTKMKAVLNTEPARDALAELEAWLKEDPAREFYGGADGIRLVDERREMFTARLNGDLRAAILAALDEEFTYD